MAKNQGSPFVKWRQKAGVPATELALALEISKTHLGDLERGTCDISDAILRRLAGIGIDPAEFHEEHIKWMEERRTTIVKKLQEVL
jgi:transcriptional regulator with XRE-family HTH domain